MRGAGAHDDGLPGEKHVLHALDGDLPAALEAEDKGVSGGGVLDMPSSVSMEKSVTLQPGCWARVRLETWPSWTLNWSARVRVVEWGRFLMSSDMVDPFAI